MTEECDGCCSDRWRNIAITTAYSPLEKAFEKQLKTIKEQWEKQREVIEE